VTTTIALTISCLVIAIVCLALPDHSPKDRWPAKAWLSLLALYGTCVGLVSTLVIYFFSLSPLIAVIVAVPAGVPTLFLFARMSEL